MAWLEAAPFQNEAQGKFFRSPLELGRTRAKIRYAGLKKIDGRSLQMNEYFRKGNEVDIKIYFDPDTHHHVMTVYFLTWNPGIGRGGAEAQCRATARPLYHRGAFQ
jgi:hypothetical protein